MRGAAVCASWFIVAVSADWSPRNEADMAPSDPLYKEVNELLKAQAAFEYGHGTAWRLRAKAKSKAFGTAYEEEARVEKAYEDHFHEMLEGVKKIAATYAAHRKDVSDELRQAKTQIKELEVRLRITRKGMADARGQVSDVQDQLDEEKKLNERQLRSRVQREKGVQRDHEQLQAMIKDLSAELAEDKDEKHALIKDVEHLKLTVNKTSHALNASKANEHAMRVERIRAEKKAEKLKTEVRKLEIKLHRDYENHTEFRREEMTKSEEAEQQEHACAKDLEESTRRFQAVLKSRDEALEQVYKYKTEVLEKQQQHETESLERQNQHERELAALRAEHTKSQDAIEQLKAKYEEEIERLKGGDDNHHWALSGIFR
eukprot:gnl/TRDRNA2_/TRDRNA2_179785_c0_seq1.p1 gnl/TRDRNA2_/TRDRNA2_179785_c0~~gnl/TRDRNA2_/TRDRNA2_179785_c0_seq1.p1  ORF type:complete len:373 (+),score=117.32 gnl/TRDRNA2_/TRDRNA2_179785_c0_seq1:64-1182(+)